MPQRAKILASSSIVIAVGLSAGLLIDHLLVRLLVVAAGLIGVAYILWRIPTRERALDQSGAL
jgi:uncharacterized membrane protein YbaN (DUF454 family)